MGEDPRIHDSQPPAEVRPAQDADLDVISSAVGAKPLGSLDERHRASTNDNNVFPLLTAGIGPFPQVNEERPALSGVQAGSPPHL